MFLNDNTQSVILMSQGVTEGSGGLGEIAERLPQHQARM